MTQQNYERVRQLFLAAREKEPGQRAAFLREACQDDDVRAEVESLLAHAAQIDTFLQTPALGGSFALAGPELLASGASTTDGLAGAPPSAVYPERIGRYRILEVLGRGGMGVVYRAEQENPRRTVALKVVRWGAESPAILQRFQHESRVLGFLHHPGIAQILEAGTADTGHGPQPYFAMEFISGRPLTEHADAQRLNVRARLELLVKTCDAVHHAHQKGVIHRDLKPGNILVDERGQPKILDFGVARVTDPDLRVSTLATHAGLIVGTLGYMSPEQVRGQPSEIDIRTDVYSLGALLYEVLAQRPPLKVAGKSLPEAARVIVEDEPTALRTLCHGISGDLEAIVAKALEKDKTRRYESAAALADDLRRFLADQPVAARPATTWYHFRKFARRNRLLVSAVAATGFILIAGIIGTSIGLTRATRAESSARREAAKASAISDFVTSMLASVEPGKQGRDVRVLDVLDQAAGDLANKYAGQPELRAALHERIGASYHRLGAYERASEQFRSAETLLRLTPGSDSELAAVLSSLGTAYHLSGHYEQAENALREAVAVRRRGGTAQAADLATTLSNFAGLLHTLGRYEDAGRAWNEALQLSRDHLPALDPQRAAILNNLGSLALRREDDATAGRLYQEALQQYEASLGPEHPDTITCRQNLAGVVARQGDLQRAEGLYRDILATRRRILGPEHAQVAVTLNNLAKVLLTRADYSGAAEMYSDALEIFEKSPGPAHPQTAVAHNNLAHALLLQDRPAEAETHAARALEICTQKLPPGHRTTAICRAEYGSALHKLKRWSDADAALRQAYDELSSAFGAEHQRAREVAGLLADSAEAQGQHDQVSLWRTRQAAPTSDPASPDR
jgi:serine/threonine protein kinase/Tfp pilus assembly protein PilF